MVCMHLCVCVCARICKRRAVTCLMCARAFCVHVYALWCILCACSVGMYVCVSLCVCACVYVCSLCEDPAIQASLLIEKDKAGFLPLVPKIMAAKEKR